MVGTPLSAKRIQTAEPQAAVGILMQQSFVIYKKAFGL